MMRQALRYDPFTGRPVTPTPVRQDRYDPHTGVLLGKTQAAHVQQFWDTATLSRGDYHSTTGSTQQHTPSTKPPWVRLVDSIIDLILAGRYFSLSSLCRRKRTAVENKGSNAPTTSMIGTLMVQNVDQSLNIDQDHKTYGTLDDLWTDGSTTSSS